MSKIFLDTETTGLSSINNRICSLTVIDDGNNVKNFLFNPQQHVQPGAAAVNGYSWNKLKKYPTFAEQAREVRAVLDSADVIVAHNAKFDIRFLQREFERCGIHWQPNYVICTMEMAKQLITTYSYKLDNLTSVLGLKNLRGKYHGSCVDTMMCKALYERLCEIKQQSANQPTKQQSVKQPAEQKTISKSEEEEFYDNIKHILIWKRDLLRPSQKSDFIDDVEKNIVKLLTAKPQYDTQNVLKGLQELQMSDGPLMSSIDLLEVDTKEGLKVYNILDSRILDDLVILNDILPKIKIGSGFLNQLTESCIMEVQAQIGGRIQTILEKLNKMTTKVDVNSVGLFYLEDKLKELQEYKPIVETFAVIHNSESSGDHLISQCKKCTRLYNNGLIKYNKYLEQKRIQVQMQLEKIFLYLRILKYIAIPILMGYILIKG